MAMRIGDSFGLVAVFSLLLMTHKVLLKEYESSQGNPILLPHHCTPSEAMHSDVRDVLVQYKLDHSSFVNRQLMPVKDDLRREIERLMSTRNEQVLSFEADEKLTYGEVSAILSDLRKDDPELFIILLTKKQVASFDDTQWHPFPDLCVS
jgi:biopolymer transport protein ExbD